MCEDCSLWRILVFKVFAARTVCKKQENKYRTVVKIWVEIMYGVCVCVCTGGERASAGKSEEKQRVTSVSYSKVTTISC